VFYDTRALVTVPNLMSELLLAVAYMQGRQSQCPLQLASWL